MGTGKWDRGNSRKPQLNVIPSFLCRSVSVATSNDVEKDEFSRSGTSETGKLGLQAAGDSRSSVCTNREHRTAAADDVPSITDMNRGIKLRVRLQTYPRELADSLVDDLAEVDFQPHGFSHSIYVVDIDGLYRYGIAPGNDMYLAPNDRVDLAKGSIARASLKLEETIQVLRFNLDKDMMGEHPTYGLSCEGNQSCPCC